MSNSNEKKIECVEVKKCCGTCNHWNSAATKNVDVGLCQRFPPVPSAIFVPGNIGGRINMPNQAPQQVVQSLIPNTNKDYCCGEYTEQIDT